MSTTRTWEQICATTRNLMNDQSPLFTQMRQILERYNGDYVVPLPSVENEPNVPSLTPALIGEAVDNMARQAASVRPIITSPAINPRNDQGVGSREYAQIRRKIISATYSRSKFRLGRRRMYRHLAAYSTFTLIVRPDYKEKMPFIEVGDPLGTFAEPMAAESLRPPEYVAVVSRYSGARLRTLFPAVKAENGGPITGHDQGKAMWDVVEWMDCEQTVYGLMGPTTGITYRDMNVADAWQNNPNMQIAGPFINRTGMCPSIVPVNLSLGGITSRLGSMLGNVDLQARLMGLNILAQEKAIFPDTYAIGRQGMMPSIVGGRWKDGREGDINLLMDVETVGALRTTPDQGTPIMIDRLERNFRISNGLTPQTGGESYGALRTGRGIDALMGVSLDPRIQELHEIEEEWMPHMNAAILSCYKSNWGSKQYSMYSSYPGDNGLVEFVPNEHIETFENQVNYTIPGADIVQQTQILGSMFGSKAISLRTFRAKHPWIDDPEAESDLVAEEELEDALRQSIFQQLMTGAIPMVLSSRIHRHLRDGKDIFLAVEKADEEVRAMQATEAPPAPEGMIADPSQMPGLAAGPGAAMAPAPAPRVEVPDDVTGMNALMSAMAGG